MQLIDTHCHIQASEFFTSEQRKTAYQQSIDSGVVGMLCVGTDLKSSQEAVEFALSHPGCYAVVGVHPHETRHGIDGIEELLKKSKHQSKRIVGIGEIGLDNFYHHSSTEDQIKALEAQLQLALDYDLPVSFHVREAFDTFWPVLNNFPNTRGVLHSFTDTIKNAEIGIGRGLLIGLNGIATFTKNPDQQVMYRDLPIEKIVVETDSPFLTPAPYRGKMNLPAYVKRVVEHIASERELDANFVATMTTKNAVELFRLSI